MIPSQFLLLFGSGSAQGEWLTTEEVRAHIYVVGTEEDEYIQSLIDAAARVIKSRTGHIVSPTTFAIQGRCFQQEAHLLVRPVQSVTVTYLDLEGVRQTVPSEDYMMLDYAGTTIIAPMPGKAWPNALSLPGSVEITIQAGYESPSAVPKDIKQIGKFLVAHWYKYREPVVSTGSPSVVPATLSWMLDAHRVRFIG